MPLEKQIVQLTFEGAQQRVGNKHLIPGQLTLAENVYQTKTREYRKRNGYGTLTRQADYAEGGALGGNVVDGYGLGSIGGALTLRGKQSAYLFDSTLNEWQFKGSVDRTFPSYTRMLPNAGNIPTMAIDSNNHAVMFGEGTDGFIYFSVVNLNDGTVAIPSSRLVGPGMNDTLQMRAIFANGQMWLIRLSGGLGVVSHALTPSSYKFYASGTSVGAGTVIFVSGTMRGIDIAPSTAGVFIVVYGAPAAGVISFMFMDTTTGGLKAVPGVVNTALGGGGSTYFATVARNDTATNIFLFAAQIIGGSLTWKAVKLNPTTLAVVSTETSWTAGTATTAYKLSGGCHVIGGSRLVGLLSRDDTAVEDQILGLVDTVFTGASVTDNFLRASWMASDIFSIGGILHYVTAHDDTNKLQTAYYLRRLTFPTGGILDVTIKARALYALTGPLHFNTRTGVFTTQGAALTYVSGNKVRMAVAEQANTAALTGTLLEFDTDAAMGPVVSCHGSAIFPAGWPQQIVGGRCVELSPMMFPRTIVINSAGAGSLAAGTYAAQALYAIRDQEGRVYRSAPTPVVSAGLGANTAVTFTVPTLRVSNPHVYPGIGAGPPTRLTVDIEIYMTRVNTTTPRLRFVMRNDTTVDSVTTPTISTQPATDAEAIYTTGDVISNSPVPPFRWSACWRNRVILGGTDEEGKVWTSQELETGVGATFNEINVSIVQGRDYAGGLIDDNYFAIFTADAVWTISGNGPDAFGRGNYEPRRLPGTIGCTNPGSVASSPQGLYYQGTDGNIYLLTPSLEQTRISDGVFDFRTETIQAAMTVAKEEQVRFFASSGKVLVWDYGRRTAANPLGQWYVWPLSAAGVGAVVQNDVAHHIASDATVRKEVAGQYFDGVSTPILPKLKMAPISFAGIQGFERVWKGQFLGDFKGAHTLQVTMERDYGAGSQVLSKAVAAGPQEFEFRPAQQRVKALALTIEQTGADLTEAFTFETVAFEVGAYGALRPMPTTRKM